MFLGDCEGGWRRLVRREWVELANLGKWERSGAGDANAALSRR
ncbi:MAG: hypothetical protein AVDCRST_MAG77-4141 [uncultured Chloroflexi bacterium]|uniref:Uncharacterized protein n=1 Tax=uncultured Chloroflexota bacterium TaxID=166587 RepID=A0A6J4JPP6_9CHLR|nr:MAG: hypothetical protein AVDCRST_MAG77-4141 [uncultured Chloroflexota bacterium]